MYTNMNSIYGTINTQNARLSIKTEITRQDFTDQKYLGVSSYIGIDIQRLMTVDQQLQQQNTIIIYSAILPAVN